MTRRGQHYEDKAGRLSSRARLTLEAVTAATEEQAVFGASVANAKTRRHNREIKDAAKAAAEKAKIKLPKFSWDK